MRTVTEVLQVTYNEQVTQLKIKFSNWLITLLVSNYYLISLSHRPTFIAEINWCQDWFHLSFLVITEKALSPEEKSLICFLLVHDKMQEKAIS